MTSIIKVDQIQNTAGNTPTAADLGLNVSGSVLQAVNFTYDTRTEVSGSASGSFSDTGLQCVITPSLSTSKILIVFNCNGVAARLGGFHQEPDLRLVRNGTEVKLYEDLIEQGGTNFWIPGTGISHSFGANYIDSPNTTSSITYKIQIRGNTNISGDMRVAINSRGDGGNTGGGGSSITLMEIAG